MRGWRWSFHLACVRSQVQSLDLPTPCQETKGKNPIHDSYTHFLGTQAFEHVHTLFNIQITGPTRISSNTQHSLW